MITPLWFSNALDWIAQVAVLVLAAGILQYVFKIRQPQVLLAFWRTVVGVSLLLPLVQPWHRQFYLQAEFTLVTLSSGEISQLISNAHAHQLSYWQVHRRELIAQSFAVVILAGIAARSTILALGLLKLRQFRRASSPILDHPASSALLDEMRVRVNTGGEFRFSSDVQSPVTFGFSAPVILLPERFPTLDAQYQSAIACHELIHVRRRDWAHHLSEEILRAVLWFHPAIAWLISRIRLSREQVVDLEVVRLTDARIPYLEALLEFTNSRALATAIPAPPFLIERQLAERVALMLKEVRMSRTRLIASLTATAACLAVVATLAIWTFPLKAVPRPEQNLPQHGITQGVPGGINGGVTGGTINGIRGGITATVPNSSIKSGVGGGVVGGVKSGVPGGILSGVTTAVPVPQPQDDASARPAPLVTTNGVPPVYPQEAIEEHLEGAVNLTITVNAEGKVSAVEFINGTPEFAQAATDAAYQWEFQPPVKAPAILSARIHFTLSPSRRTPETPSIAAYKDPRAVSSLEMEVVKQDPSPQSASTPATNNDSRFVGKFQFIPPATASSQKFQPIPPVVESSPRALIVHPGDPSTTTNRGTFQTVSPSEPAVSRNPNSRSTAGQTARAGENGVTMPACEYCPRPEYSQEARDANLQGTVFLQIVVLTNGRAGEIKVIKGLEKSLDEQAIKVVREKWTFKPATDRDGNPVDVLVPVDIAFLLVGPPQPTPPPMARPAGASPATVPLIPNESLQAKIFKGPVTDNGTSTPFYIGLVNTQTIYAPQPELPRLARQAHVQGPVTLNIVVNTEGKVIVVEYVKGPAMLAQAAISTVRDWIIKGTHDGAPVTFQISVEVSFSDK